MGINQRCTYVEYCLLRNIICSVLGIACYARSLMCIRLFQLRIKDLWCVLGIDNYPRLLIWNWVLLVTQELWCVLGIANYARSSMWSGYC
jgi:hypothetical protein